MLCSCGSPIQLLCWANSSGLAAELLSQRTICVIQTYAAGGKRARKACTMKLCRPGACPNQSHPTTEQRGAWRAGIISCLSSSSSSQLSKAQGKVSCDSLPRRRCWLADFVWETQPFCATQLSSYKATGSTMTPEVIENSIGNRNFPFILVLELATPCTHPRTSLEC